MNSSTTTEALPSIADVCEEYYRQSCDCSGGGGDSSLFHKRAPGWGKRAGNGETEENPAELFGRLTGMKRAPGWGKRSEK